MADVPGRRSLCELLRETLSPVKETATCPRAKRGLVLNPSTPANDKPPFTGGFFRWLTYRAGEAAPLSLRAARLRQPREAPLSRTSRPVCLPYMKSKTTATAPGPSPKSNSPDSNIQIGTPRISAGVLCPKSTQVRHPRENFLRYAICIPSESDRQQEGQPCMLIRNRSKTCIRGFSATIRTFRRRRTHTLE